MAPTVTMTLLLCLVGVALLSGGPTAKAQDECFNGQVCCTNCNTRCVGNTFACKRNCKSPCIPGPECEAIGISIAKGAATAACSQAKFECNIEFIQADGKSYGESPFVDLETCCEVVVGSCQGDAELIPCTVEDNDYGDCSPEEFRVKYLQLVSQDCKDTVCLDNVCSAALAGNSKCS